MNKINKNKMFTIMTMMIGLIFNTTEAKYIFHIPIESNNGGVLPINSIKFKTSKDSNIPENWIKTESEYSQWIDLGIPNNCLSISLDESSPKYGTYFIRREADCEQNQTRTIQEREQETTTLEYRNIGIKSYENRILYDVNALTTTELTLDSNCYFGSDTYLKNKLNQPYINVTMFLGYWGLNTVNLLGGYNHSVNGKNYNKGVLVTKTVNKDGSGFEENAICLE